MAIVRLPDQKLQILRLPVTPFFSVLFLAIKIHLRTIWRYIPSEMKYFDIPIITSHSFKLTLVEWARDQPRQYLRSEMHRLCQKPCKYSNVAKTLANVNNIPMTIAGTKIHDFCASFAVSYGQNTWHRPNVVWTIIYELEHTMLPMKTLNQI